MKGLHFLFFFYLIIGSVIIVPGCEQPCDGVNCLNDGTCVDGDCQCLPGSSGEHCENVWRSALLGQHSGTEFCMSSYDFYDYDINIENGLGGLKEIRVEGLFGIEELGWFATMSSPDSFKFSPDQQQFSNGGVLYYLVSGTGSITGSEVEINYIIEADSEKFECGYVFKL